MDDWKELLDLMQRLPRGSDQYNQVVGDAVVAVERGIKELEAEKIQVAQWIEEVHVIGMCGNALGPWMRLKRWAEDTLKESK